MKRWREIVQRVWERVATAGQAFGGALRRGQQSVREQTQMAADSGVGPSHGASSNAGLHAVAGLSELTTGIRLAFEGLTKDQFLTSNDVDLTAMIAAINRHLRAEHGASFTQLTRHDVWVLIYTEAGLRDGLVDPDHRHSLGERGLLPLPDNIRDWNGPAAPQWNNPMPLVTNCEQFALYLAQIKNRDLTGEPRHLYRGLFQLDGIAGNPVRAAKLLAGVVHGYFYRPNYRDKIVPFDHLLEGYRRERPLAEMLATTTYVHANTEVIRSRAANIDAALRLV